VILTTINQGFDALNLANIDADAKNDSCF